MDPTDRLDTHGWHPASVATDIRITLTAGASLALALVVALIRFSGA